MVNSPECTLTAPTTLPNCAALGRTLSVAGTFANYDWTVTGNGTYVSGDGTNTLVYNVGSGGTINISLTVTDAAGCTATCTVSFGCVEVGKACTPGFWKTHQEVWDNQSDATVNNMPGTLTSPVTAGGTFVASTSFWAYFNLAQGSISGIPNTPLTMAQAAALGGGNCNALARHGVAALLGASAFPAVYPYPAEAGNYAGLYTMIRNAFISGDCGAAHATLAAINEAFTGKHCGDLGKLTQIANTRNVSRQTTQASTTVGASANKLTLSAYPNPFNDVVNFQFVSPRTGQASLEMYDIVGRKLGVVYQGTATAFIPINVRYNVPAIVKGTLFYKLVVDGNTIHGSLLSRNK